MGSAADKISGKANQAIGAATGNDKVKAKGQGQETRGKLKDKVKQAGESLSAKVDQAAKKSDK